MAALSALSMLKNSPVKFTPEQTMGLIRCFGEFMVELGERGIPITEFQHTDEREAAAVLRLGMPEHVKTFLASVKQAAPDQESL
jgi:hypothetical protein